ncbi:MAG: thiamine phosphate synthase [Candidatus Omnitrophota bacterium]|nr:thiamine phosphate synthase [Candidatus Omnitrophota bacterium]
MSWKKRLLKESRLYVIVDKTVSGRRPIFNIVNNIKDTGAGIIQLRDKESKKESILKEAYKLRQLLTGTKTIFIINDYIDIAKIADSDGIHLGQNDLSVHTARQLLGKDKIIGVSCHNLNQAIRAQKNGADYISIGPIFSTPTKPEYKAVGLDLIKKVKKAMHIPFFVIGGINEHNITSVMSEGIKKVAICRAICRAKDILFTIKKLSKILHRSSE